MMLGLKGDPEAERRLADFKDQVLRAERADRATKYLIEEAGGLVPFLESVWQPNHVIAVAKTWVDRALKIKAVID